jgi:hypothetical protein
MKNGLGLTDIVLVTECHGDKCDLFLLCANCHTHVHRAHMTAENCDGMEFPCFSDAVRAAEHCHLDSTVMDNPE